MPYERAHLMAAGREEIPQGGADQSRSTGNQDSFCSGGLEALVACEVILHPAVAEEEHLGEAPADGAARQRPSQRAQLWLVIHAVDEDASVFAAVGARQHQVSVNFGLERPFDLLVL